jgi:hypothetical protein
VQSRYAIASKRSDWQLRLQLGATAALIVSHDVERVLADIDADHGDSSIDFL